MEFKYNDVLKAGRPKHIGWDSFKIKHPPMPVSKWAKIYAPFDALKGFDEEIESQEEIFIEKPLLSDYQKEELDAKIRILAQLTINSKMARENQVMATVDYYDAGKIKKVSGQVWRVDLRTIRIDEELIGMDSIVGIDSPVFTAYGEL